MEFWCLNCRIFVFSWTNTASIIPTQNMPIVLAWRTAIAFWKTIRILCWIFRLKIVYWMEDKAPKKAKKFILNAITASQTTNYTPNQPEKDKRPFLIKRLLLMKSIGFLTQKPSQNSPATPQTANKPLAKSNAVQTAHLPKISLSKAIIWLPCIRLLRNLKAKWSWFILMFRLILEMTVLLITINLIVQLG